MSTMRTERKSFTYKTGVEWLRRKACTLQSAGKPSFRVASPPEFRGEPNVWTPEDLLVAAVESCFLMTFASLIEHRHLAVEAYSSEAEGLLEWDEDGYRFTRVTIRPTVVVTDSRAVQPVMTALQDAKRDCLIARSLSGEVELTPDVEISVTE